MKRLRELRQAQKITQVKLAMDVNISQKMISAYERGTNEPSLEMLIKFACYFNTSIDYLVGHSDIKQPLTTLVDQSCTGAEINLLESFRNLSKDNKLRVEGYVSGLLDSQF